MRIEKIVIYVFPGSVRDEVIVRIVRSREGAEPLIFDVPDSSKIAVCRKELEVGEGS